MATTKHSASISTERAHAPRFRFGSLEAWRAALFVSLGLGAACGGDADGDGGDGGSAVSSSLQCQGDDALPSGLWQCDNGIVHRRTGSDDEPCVGCIRPPLSPSDECSTDADCADGSLCAQTRDLVNASLLCGLPVIEVGVPYFACLSSADICGADSQCRGAICARAEGVRECYEHTAQPCGVPGRPFLVGAEIRRAPLRAAGGWCDASIAPADGLDERQRVSAARHYREAALLEHASIAAFARFTLQLLELGAPADLCSALRGPAARARSAVDERRARAGHPRRRGTAVPARRLCG
jgi:hypothetical protein